MAVLTGKSGDLTFGSGYDVHCNSWTVDFATDAFEDTELGDSWRTRVIGLNNWSGSFDCALDDASLTTITMGGFGKAAAEAVFTYAGGGTITGSIAISGASVNSSVTGVNTITFTFEGSGAPVIA